VALLKLLGLTEIASAQEASGELSYQVGESKTFFRRWAFEWLEALWLKVSHGAALRVQSIHRGRAQQRRFQSFRQSQAKIAAVHRGRAVRREQRVVAAAALIQSACRMHTAREQVRECADELLAHGQLAAAACLSHSAPQADLPTTWHSTGARARGSCWRR